MCDALARELHEAITMRSSGSWMLAQLDFATRGHHVHADAGRMALLSSSVTRERYEDYLVRMFAFEAPIEARWRATEGLSTIVEVPSRFRAGFLLSDLAALAIRPELPPAAPFVGVEQALGWMYVVERGRRMHSLLGRHLARRLPQVMAIAGNYLGAASPCGLRWQQFGEALDRFATHHVIVDQIINAAHRGFRLLRQQTPQFPATTSSFRAA
jgi:heme oxygenase